jgi:glycerophosphoryl diester phosphodiesterase
VSRVVLAILARYGYATKTDNCFLQCFEWAEVQRLRNDLGWRGLLVFLIETKAKGDDGTDFEFLSSPAGMKEVAKVADGIGPSIARLMTWSPNESTPRFSGLVQLARAEKLAVHPYTIRVDELPKNCPSVEALHAALFKELRVDGVFTDFTDVTAAWLRKNGVRR